MAGADSVLRVQNIAGMDDEMFALARLEISVPLNVTTNCTAGAVCQANAPPETVS